MDYTMLDVGPIQGVAVGDTVTLIGRDGRHAIGVPEIASLVGTIPYEIACSVGKRVQRVHVTPVEQPLAAPARAPARAARATRAAVRAGRADESSAGAA
jgi:hypothetical protein